MIEIYHYNPLIIYDINMSDLFVTFFLLIKKRKNYQFQKTLFTN